jgi:hypothetical protein
MQVPDGRRTLGYTISVRPFNQQPVSAKEGLNWNVVMQACFADVCRESTQST